MVPPAPRTWIYFLLSKSAGALTLPAGARINRYAVTASHLHRGESVTGLNPGDEICRICSNEPIPVPPNTLSGCTQHLHYTSDAQRDRLLSISAKEIPASEKPVTVLIPIRKSDTWWNLAHNLRADHMNGTHTHRGHTKAAEEYAPMIFRQLIHSRYMDTSKRPYDFLTYFEFPDLNTAPFKSLLQTLRDEFVNPEWAHVEMEQEVWMRKVD
ncbi:MAG: chlorite dismutase family protein [Planctomycetota bacterium]